MHSKVLLPLDGSLESEKVVDIIGDDLAPDGVVTLLHVIPPAKTIMVAGQIMDSSGMLASERSKAMTYLREVVHRLGLDPSRWHCQVVVSESVSRGIVEFATKEGFDLIAMYTHDRKGIAKLIKGSIAQDVRRKAHLEVRVVKPKELALV